MMLLTPLARCLCCLSNGGVAQEEPDAVLDGKTMRLSVIFELVANRAFKDEVPGSMRELLQTYAARDPERKREIAVLALHPTYETAAQCLLTRVGYKKTKWSGK
jgi:hypothetical protein